MRCAARWASRMRRSTTDARSTGGSVPRKCAVCASSRKRTPSSSDWSPIYRSTRVCCRACWQKNSKAFPQAYAGGGFDRALWRESTKACALLRISRSLYNYRSRARDARPLVQRIKEIAATRVHYGYRRVHVLLRREGWRDNCKRVYRLYRLEGLSLRHKRPRRNRSARLRQPKQLVSAINEIWSADFVADALFDGRRLRALTVVDNYTRECLAIEVGPNLKGEDVVRTLMRISTGRGKPRTMKSDNGSEFISKAMDRWAYENGVELDFSRPGKPTETPRSSPSTGASAARYGRFLA